MTRACTDGAVNCAMDGMNMLARDQSVNAMATAELPETVPRNVVKSLG